MLRRYSVLITFILFAASLFAQSANEIYQEGIKYKKDGKRIKAVRTFEDALKLAEESGDEKLQMSIHIELAELKNNIINYKEALDHYEAFSTLYKRQLTREKRELKDSVDNLETEVAEGVETMKELDNEIVTLNEEKLKSENEKQALALEKKELALQNKNQQLEIQQHENRRNVLILALGMGVLVLLFLVLGYLRKRKTNRKLSLKNQEIASEKKKSDELLLNILPESTAEELKEKGSTSSKKYENVSIMFTDFKGFTRFSEQYSPEKLVNELDEYFRAFDEIMNKYGIEKIKTIGDAYMCVSGVPEGKESHAKNMVSAAFEIRDFVRERAQKLKSEGKSFLEMRIGIHSGTLVAGVVGSKKFAFDVWGDAVNIAARMEQSGQPGEINISEDFYRLIKDDFQCEYRGDIEAKNKGKLKMYFVKSS